MLRDQSRPADPLPQAHKNDPHTNQPEHKVPSTVRLTQMPLLLPRSELREPWGRTDWRWWIVLRWLGEERGQEEIILWCSTWYSIIGLSRGFCPCYELPDRFLHFSLNWGFKGAWMALGVQHDSWFGLRVVRWNPVSGSSSHRNCLSPSLPLCPWPAPFTHRHMCSPSVK